MNLYRNIEISHRKIIKRVGDIYFVEGIAVKDEDSLCIACTKWFDRVIGRPFDMIHIPNGGSRNAIEGAKFKKMGVRSGVPDYLLSNNGSLVGFMEFKYGKNNLQESQKKFRDYVTQAGVKWAEIRSFDDFRDTLVEWGIYNTQIKCEEN